MIVNLWQRVKLHCGNHDGDAPLMEPHAAADSNTARSLYGNSAMNMFYSCPKYYPENRGDGEPCCRNHISMKEFETMLDKISGELEKAQKNDMTCDLKGLQWKSKSGVVYMVTKHKEDEIDVTCINTKSLWK